MGHVLIHLPKADPNAATNSGKCSCGEARYNAFSESQVEQQHVAHLQDIGLAEAPETPEQAERRDEALVASAGGREGLSALGDAIVSGEVEHRTADEVAEELDRED